MLVARWGRGGAPIQQQGKSAKLQGQPQMKAPLPWPAPLCPCCFLLALPAPLFPPLPSRRRSQEELSDGKTARPRTEEGKGLASSWTSRPCFWLRGRGIPSSVDRKARGKPPFGAQPSIDPGAHPTSALLLMPPMPPARPAACGPQVVPPPSPPPPPPPVPVQGVGVRWFPLTFAAGRSQIASAHGQFSELPLGPAPVLFAQEAWRWSFPKCPLGSNHPSGGGKPQVAIPALLRISLMSFCTILNLHASVSSPVPWREQHLPWAVVGLG